MFSLLSPRLKNPVLPRYGISDLLPWLCLAVAFFFATIFHGKYATDLLDSDMAAEMILAKELNDSHSLLFAKNWFYSTEIRVLYQHIPLRLGLLLFPNRWMYARVFAQSVMLVLQAASFIYLMSSLGLRKAGIYGAAALMCPFGFWYTFYGVYNGMYLSHMILYSVSIALIIRLVKPGGFPLKRGFQLIFLFFLSFMQGLSSIRMLMNLYVPLCLAAVIILVLHCSHTPLSKPFLSNFQIRLLALAVGTALVCCIGYFVNFKYLSTIYHFKDYTVNEWVDFQFHDLLHYWSAYLKMFGYPIDSYMLEKTFYAQESIPLFSIYGILTAASFVLMAAVLFSMFRLCKLWNKLSAVHQTTFLLLPVCLVVDAIAYGCLSQTVYNSYWLPLVPLSFAVVIIWVVNETFLFKSLYQRGIGIVLGICIICTSISSAHQFIHVPPRTAVNILPVVKWLESNEYYQGYASFWFSNVLTEHSNGKIEMWTLTNHKGANPIQKNVYKWLQKQEHLDSTPEGSCFVLLFHSELENADALAYNISEGTIVYEDGLYTVLGYDSVEDIIKIN